MVSTDVVSPLHSPKCSNPTQKKIENYCMSLNKRIQKKVGSKSKARVSMFPHTKPTSASVARPQKAQITRDRRRWIKGFFFVG